MEELKVKYSSINKYPIEYALAYDTLLDITNTITVLYKIIDIENDTAVIYNMSYLTMDKEELYISHVCPSGSIVSKGGEYRNNLLNWLTFNNFLNENNSVKNIYYYIQTHFKEIFAERKFELITEYICDDKLLQQSKKICKPFKIHMFCITWFNFYYDYVLGVLPNNLNKSFIDVMLMYKREDTSFFKHVLKKFNFKDINIYYYITNNMITTHKAYTYKNVMANICKIGQKITILSLAEYQNLFNIEYSVWRELSINNSVSDLVVNKISNGFALSNNWFLIKLTNGLFDNTQQYERMNRSKMATKIIDLLTQAKNLTFFNNDKQEVSNDFVKSALLSNNEMSVLKDAINNSIDYAEDNIIMADTVLNMVSEYLGKTFYDISFTKPNIYALENFPTFKKYMFQLCYNLYCLHTKVHTIHGDLHLNNIILNPLFHRVKTEIEGPKIMYNIGEEQYIFDNNFRNICIIDFDRSIINPENYNDFHRKDVPRAFANITSKDSLLQSQTHNLLLYLYSIKPEYKQFNNVIESNMLYHFDIYFKVLSTLDIYNITSKLISFTKNHINKKIATRSLKVIQDINKMANYYITTVFENLIKTSNFVEILDMDWPILSIIKKVFAENILQTHTLCVVDEYTYDNPMTHSLSNHLYFTPDLMKAETSIRKKYEKNNNNKLLLLK